jgi:hypothetical protein
MITSVSTNPAIETAALIGVSLRRRDATIREAKDALPTSLTGASVQSVMGQL